MRYIIMCGGSYKYFGGEPRQMLRLKGEPLVARTIRLLRENGVEDIAISATDERFEQFGVPVLRHDNSYAVEKDGSITGYWCEGFYPTDEPVCYVFGDVAFSAHAIRTIVETETDDVAFFGSAPPFPQDYVKPYIEPFGFKVVDTDHFWKAIDDVKLLEDEGRFKRHHIAWEVWNVISRGPEGDVNYIDYTSYVHINDWTNDIDFQREKELLNIMADESKGEETMAEAKKAAKKKPAEKKPKAKKEFEVFKARVANVNLNVRSKPGLDGDIIKVLPAGETVEVIGQKKDWYQIQDGWIMERFVERS